jgi:hypothetical protein
LGWWTSQWSSKRQDIKQLERHHAAIYAELQDVQSAMKASINTGTGSIIDALGNGRAPSVSLGKIYAPFYEGHHIECINSCTQSERLMLKAIYEGLADYNERCEIINDAQNIRGDDGRIDGGKWANLNSGAFRLYGRTIALNKLVSILLGQNDKVKTNPEQLSQMLGDLDKEGTAECNARLQVAHKKRIEIEERRKQQRLEREQAMVAEALIATAEQKSETPSENQQKPHTA